MGLIEKGKDTKWTKENIAPKGQPPHFIEVKPTLPVNDAIKQSDYTGKVVRALHNAYGMDSVEKSIVIQT